MEILVEIASDINIDEAEEVGNLRKAPCPNRFGNINSEQVVSQLRESLVLLEEMKKFEGQLQQKNSKHNGKILTMLEPLHIFERQCNMALEIFLLEDERQQDMQLIQEKYNDLGAFGIRVEHRNHICSKMFTHCLGLNSRVLMQDLKVIFEKLLKGYTPRRMGELQIIMAKIKTVCEYLPFAAKRDNNDLFALEDDDPYWTDVRKIVKVETVAPSQTLRRSYKKLVKQLSMGVSALSRGAKSKNAISRNLVIGLGGIYDVLASSQAQRRAKVFYSKPDPKTTFQLWNMLDQKAVIQVLKVAFKTVAHSKRIYLPTLYDSLTFECVHNAFLNKTLNTCDPILLECLEKPVNNTGNKPPSYKQLRKKDRTKIPLRVISVKPLPITKLGFIRDSLARNQPPASPAEEEKNDHNKKDKVGLGTKIAQCFKGLRHLGRSSIPKAATDPYFDGVIFHIHGGGFVAMSSASHQVYTRQWAQIVNKPVLSVDYKLAPQYPFPGGLNDCWQAYNWILNDMKQTLGINPSKIILVGDSAGGNLVLGVTFLAIKNKVRVPDGLLLAYPALNLDSTSYSPSLLLALDDQILPYSVLKMIAGVYIPAEGQPSQDPLLSPCCASNELLKQLPPVRMMVGNRDPFHDECWRFADKLRKLEKDISMVVYEDMPHGFLGFDLPGGMTEVRKCIKDGADMLLELLSI